MADLVPETRDRILDAALRAMGRLGLRRLTMGDVSEQAGLSRGTIYRYFPNKETLLAVLAEYEQDRFAGGLGRVLAGVPAGEVHLGHVVGYILAYLRDHPALTSMIDLEPAFVLGFLRRQLPVFHTVTEQLIGPVMRATPPVREGRLSADELNELLLRVVLSVLLVPGESSSAAAGVLEGTLDSFVRLVDAPGSPAGPPRRPNGRRQAEPRRRSRQT
jgi:AcrR family transcriptional regulator